LPTFNAATRKERLSPEIKKLITEHIANNEETLEFLYDAAKIKHSRYPVDLTRGINVLLSHLSGCKENAKLLCLKALAESENGRAAKAVEDIAAAVAAGTSLEKEPVLISQLVRMSCVTMGVQCVESTLSRVEYDDQQLRRLMGLFAEVENSDLLLNAMAGERAMVIDFILYPSDYSGGSGFHPVVLHMYSASGLNKSGLLEYLECIDDNFAAMRLPLHERIDALKPLAKRFEEFAWYHALVKEFGNDHSRLAAIEIRSIAYLRLCRAGLAVQRYRAANGRLPDGLDEIAPGFIEAVPIDPFDDAALRYKRLDKGFVVYSVGKDGVDNGGLEPNKDNRDACDVTFIVER